MADDELVVNSGAMPMTTVADTLDKFMHGGGVNQVYGRPIKKDEITIVPAAELVTALGFGVGSGGGTSASDSGSGGGGGGGGRTFSRPVAVIVVEPQGVRVEPVIDVTKVALAALTAAGFMFSTMRKMRSGGANE